MKYTWIDIDAPKKGFTFNEIIPSDIVREPYNEASIRMLAGSVYDLVKKHYP